MGFFDRFKPKFEGVGKDKKPRNVVEAETAKKKAAGAATDAGASKAVKPVKSDKKRATKDDTGHAYRILQHALITEKASLMAAQRQYSFAVHPAANKAQVAEAVTSVYGVTPTAVQIIRVSGKKIRFGRIEGRTKKWKKAIVTLPEGEKIDLYEGV